MGRGLICDTAASRGERNGVSGLPSYFLISGAAMRQKYSLRGAIHCVYITVLCINIRSADWGGEPTWVGARGAMLRAPGVRFAGSRCEVQNSRSHANPPPCLGGYSYKTRGPKHRTSNIERPISKGQDQMSDSSAFARICPGGPPPRGKLQASAHFKFKISDFKKKNYK
jgi:hypothetical protein